MLADHATLVSELISSYLPVAQKLAGAQAKRTSVCRDDLMGEAYLAVVEYCNSQTFPDSRSMVQHINSRLNRFCKQERARTHPSLDIGTSPAAEENIMENEIITRLYEILYLLTDRERVVLVETTIHDRTYADVGEELGISAATVYRIRESTLERCRRYMAGTV